jgi:hypothetical protein
MYIPSLSRRHGKLTNLFPGFDQDFPPGQRKFDGVCLELRVCPTKDWKSTEVKNAGAYPRPGI